MNHYTSQFGLFMYFLEFSGTFGHSQHMTKRASTTQIIKESRCRSLDNIRANVWTKGTTLTSDGAHLCLFMLICMQIVVSQVQVHRKLHRCHWMLKKGFFWQIFLLLWFLDCFFSFYIFDLMPLRGGIVNYISHVHLQDEAGGLYLRLIWALTFLLVKHLLWQTSEDWQMNFLLKDLTVNSSDHRLFHCQDLIFMLFFAPQQWAECMNLKRATLLHWATCSLITTNMCTVVKLELIPHRPSCCCENSLLHQMCRWK